MSKNNLIIQKPTRSIYSYGSTKPIELLGQCFTTFTYGNKRYIAPLVIAATEKAGNILSRTVSEKLELLDIPDQINTTITSTKEPSLNHILQKYESITKGTGKLKDFQLKIETDPAILPVIHKPRRIPFHQRQAVEQELDKLLKEDIIEPVDHATTWVQPVVISHRKNGDIRICLDLRTANKAIKRVRHPIPTLPETLEKLNGCKYFSKNRPSPRIPSD